MVSTFECNLEKILHEYVSFFKDHHLKCLKSLKNSQVRVFKLHKKSCYYLIIYIKKLTLREYLSNRNIL